MRSKRQSSSRTQVRHRFICLFVFIMTFTYDSQWWKMYESILLWHPTKEHCCYQLKTLHRLDCLFVKASRRIHTLLLVCHEANKSKTSRNPPDSRLSVQLSSSWRWDEMDKDHPGKQACQSFQTLLKSRMHGSVLACLLEFKQLRQKQKPLLLLQ